MRFNLVPILGSRSLLKIILGLSLTVLSACGGPLYKVAPLPKSAAAETPGVSAAGLGVSAVGLSDEQALAQFDANLPLAGLIAVEIRLTNGTSAPIAVGGLRLLLYDSGGKALKPLAPKKALGRVMKFYGVRLYGKEGYARTLESYEAIGLRLDRNLPPAEEIAGILFFDAKTPVTDLSMYRLAIEGGPSPVSLRL